MLFEQLSVQSSYGAIVSQCLNGLAVGSFLFVSCIEMIPPEFHKKTAHTPVKFVVLVVGFLLMAGISAFHSH
jgi:zinc transporter ZupT